MKLFDAASLCPDRKSMIPRMKSLSTVLEHRLRLARRISSNCYDNGWIRKNVNCEFDSLHNAGYVRMSEIYCFIIDFLLHLIHF